MGEAAEAVDAAEGVELRDRCRPPDLVAGGDPVLLRQVLIGLLTNAFKHTPAPGAVTLRARRGEDEEIVIEVTDTGTGIAPDEVDRVFERFYRGRARSRRRASGSASRSPSGWST